MPKSYVVTAINKVQKALETEGLTIGSVESGYRETGDGSDHKRYTHVQVIILVPEE